MRPNRSSRGIRVVQEGPSPGNLRDGMMEKGSRGRMRPGAAHTPSRSGWQQEERGSIGASRPTPFSIGALISQGDGSSCRGRLLYLERLWFGIERGADEVA